MLLKLIRGRPTESTRPEKLRNETGQVSRSYLMAKEMADCQKQMLSMKSRSVRELKSGDWPE